MDTPAGEEARRKMGDELMQTQIGKIITDGLALGYQYAESPIVFGDGTVPLASSVSEYRPTTFPGGRAPHAWLSEGRSILDVFGNGFTLLRLGADAPQPSSLARAFEQRRVPLDIVSIADPAICALYERPLVLVRPDGHVAWRGDADPPAPLRVVDRVRGAETAAVS